MKNNLPQLEKRILDFWERSKIFQKTTKKKNRNFVFYEGPPTANARPGVHHVLARVYKDIICRYKTMKGFRVIRRAGWDTHGLPVELEIEKKLGLKSKKEIEKFGIDKFNQECRKSVLKYVKDWQDLTERIGYWLDMENPYITYSPKYIETLWWILKEISKKGLLYQDYKVVPYCPRCQTALSSHEVAQGYKRIKEPAIYVKFKIKDEKFEKPTYLLVWTTTPWTLPANVAIAVHPDFRYILAEKDKERFILLEARKEILGEKFKILERFKGKELEGLKYEALFEKEEVRLDLSSKNIYKVLLADFVSKEEGTGLVHIAPAFGQEDMELIKNQNLKTKIQNEKIPIILTVDEEGKFNEKVKLWKGMFVKEADPSIIEYLKEKRKIFKVEEYEHDYPFCWRCKTPLLYYAKKSWFIATKKVKDKLIQNNQKINWIPEHIKNGRFGEWLKEIKDWTLSRERYWGTPLPVWRCQNCNHQVIIGSRKDLLKQKFSTNKYYILRHGEAKNVTNFVYSSIPEIKKYPLTEKGKKQIQRRAESLKKEGIDLIFSSDVLRCKQSAEILGKILGIRPIFDSRLREIDQGKLNGKKIDVARKFWDPEGKMNIQQFTMARIRKPAPGGESFVDVRRRMLDFIRETDKKYQNKKILIISHEAPFLMLETAMKGLTLEESAKYRARNFLKVGELRKIEFKYFPYNQEGELDFHRPYVDEIEFFCPKCGGKMKREKVVIDCWFDSGSMPFAQWHYPFENKNLIDKKIQFPADYISEAIDQTRGWFYTLLAVSTLLGFGPPYKNVIVLGHVLDEKGQKMSKSRGNVVEPYKMLEKYGADALRWYFFTINPPDYPKLFSEKDLKKTVSGFLVTYLNCYRFLEIYAPKKQKFLLPKIKNLNILDRWIISRLNSLIDEVGRKLERFDVVTSARMIEKFVNEDLSLWYIRRSRERFQRPENKKELRKAVNVLGYVLLTTSKLTAPFVPFLSEFIYKNLKGEKKSVHLEEWPRSKKDLIDKELEEEMKVAREIAGLGLRLRAKAKIKVRQPLNLAEIKPKKQVKKEILKIVEEELNIKKILQKKSLKRKPNFVYGKEGEIEMQIDTTITEELKEEGMVRELIRILQELRKKASLTPQEKVDVWIKSSRYIKKVVEENKKKILEQTKTKNIYFHKEKPAGRILQEKDAFLDKAPLLIRLIRPKK